MEIRSYTVRPTTKDEHGSMPYVTSSMVEAVVTCPKWGIVHNVLRKRFTTGYRQMALEAGSLMHEVFSVYNLYQIAKTQNLLDHAVHHGQILFPNGRFDALNFTSIVNGDYSQMRMLEKLAYTVIGSSDFYDEVTDKNRTLANLEHCSIELANYFLMNHVNFPIWIKDLNDPTKEIGIEKSLDVVFDICLGDNTIRSLRFIGLADVLYHRVNGEVKLGEYKTTSSMNDGWTEAFRTRNQLSAYYGALGAHFDNVAEEIILTGSTIPVRKTTVSVQHFNVDRTEQSVFDFLRTALFAMDQINAYKDNPVIAPMFTHSCNRYFRPCALLDLCTAEVSDQYVMLEQMKIDEQMSPSEMKAFLRQE